MANIDRLRFDSREIGLLAGKRMIRDTDIAAWGDTLAGCAGIRSAGIKPTVFETKKARLHFCNRALLLLKNPAIPTFALVGTIIGSESLTTVFGMGTGGPFGYGHRERATGAVAHCDPVGL